MASPNAEGRRIQRLFDDVCGVRKGTKALDALALRLKADETLLRARATRCGPKVYDVTKYLDSHPGGAEVMMEVMMVLPTWHQP